ncbi:MAG: hypothetical protein AAF355_15035 [Myxococcota bacterium]
MHDLGPIDQNEETLFQHLAEELLLRLFVLVKLALVHRMDNKAVTPALQRFREALTTYQKEIEGDVAVQMVDDAVYINYRLVRASLDTYERASFLKVFFSRMGVHEISFISKVEDKALRDFLQAVRAVSLDADEADKVRARKFKGIQFRELKAMGIGAQEAMVLPNRIRVIRAYGVLVITIRELLAALANQEQIRLLAFRRAIQDLARLPEETKPLQLGLLSLEHYHGKAESRLANVALLAMMMGRRLQLLPSKLRDLGTAAALGLIGRAVRPEFLFASAEEVAQADAFLKGIRQIAPYFGQGRAVSLRIVVAADQQTAEGRRNGHPVSRIAAVADRYDIWTQPEPFGLGLRPDMALHRLLETRDLDPTATKLLVQTLGLFPVGSTVKLSSGHTAIVVDTSSNPEYLASPKVMIIADDAGNPCQRQSLDLATSEVQILGTVEAKSVNLNVGHFLFS